MHDYEAGTYDIAVIGAGHGDPEQRGRAHRRAQAFSPTAKTLPQGGFIPPEEEKGIWGPRVTGAAK